MFPLFANTADGVWISGPQGEIMFWNAVAERLLGWSAEQVVGRYCRDVFGGCDGNGNRLCGWPCPVKMASSGGQLLEHFPMATRTKSGEPRWIDVSCIVVPSEEGGPPVLVHLFRDVTAGREIESLVREQLVRSKERREEGLPSIPQLSRREMQIVTLLRTGASTAAIAEALCISPKTVRNHVQNILLKLGVHTRLEAVACVNAIASRR